MIRRAAPEDTEVCVGILSRWIEETPWMPMVHSRASMISFWRGRLTEAEGWIVNEDGFALRDGNFISALYVAKQARNTGVGTRLLETAAGGRGTKLWTFQANTAARAFYQRRGVSEVFRTDGDNEEGLPDVLLERLG
ncbi:MAG: GNAT family N-acetyltransferase [Rhodobacteraceae bacterium]|nr:GNAT family N-acetyltransferase [Paracoccaceae bacterium]